MAHFGNELADRYVASWWAGAVCSVLEDWVSADEDMPTEDLVALGTMLMRQGIATVGSFAGLN